MQTSNIYSIYDRKAGYYLPVFNLRSDADALRSFTDMVVSSDTPVSKYPADFDLIRLASMDLETGLVTPVFPVHIVINGLVCLQTAQVERSRYQALMSQQMDIEDVLAENP